MPSNNAKKNRKYFEHLGFGIGNDVLVDNFLMLIKDCIEDNLATNMDLEINYNSFGPAFIQTGTPKHDELYIDSQN